MSKNSKFIIYAIGYLGIAILTQAVVKWYQYFYAPPEANEWGLDLLIPISFIGLAMIVARVVDGIADPVVAFFSDKSKHRLGRRIPFILYGTVPLVITFVLIWFPPVQGQSMINLIYLTIILCFFFIFFTVVVAPYLALIGELSDTKEERIRITTYQGITQIIGLMIAEAGSGVIINYAGFKAMGISLGLIAFATIILTPIFIREKKRDISVAATVSFTESMKRTMKNRNFLIYLFSYLTVWFGLNTLTITMPYISEILLGKTADHSGILVAGAFIAALLFSPIIPKLHKRASKKIILFLCSIAFATILALTGLFGTVLPYYFSVITVILAGIPLAVFFVVPNAMVVDIAQQDEMDHGENRAGMFFGMQGLIIKIVMGVSSFYTPLLFNLFGYSKTEPLGIQLAGPISAAFILFGAFILLKYDLKEEELENMEK